MYLTILVAFTAASYNLVASYVGRAGVAIRDSDIAAEAMGVSESNAVQAARLCRLVVLHGRPGGALHGLFLGHLEPQTFNLSESITLFVAVVVGGLASVEGSIMGRPEGLLGRGFEERV